jgi:geranylgeranyl pyrophosphate synthase
MLTAAREDKLEEDVSWLLARLVECGSMDHGGAFARNRALAAKKRLENLSETLRPGVHRDFLEQLMTYVVARDK